MASHRVTEPACILCWCHSRATVPAAMFDGIAWYCEDHGEQVIHDRLRPRWRRTIAAILRRYRR
jgi:hypothetical protein